MLRKVTWPAAYQNISVSLFVQGYLITMNSQDSSIKHRMAEHLKDLMSDAEMYGWDRTEAFHGVWMNHIEQGQAHGLIIKKRSSSGTGLAPSHFPPAHPRSGCHQNLPEDRPVQVSLQHPSHTQQQGMQGLQPVHLQQG